MRLYRTLALSITVTFGLLAVVAYFIVTDISKRDAFEVAYISISTGTPLRTESGKLDAGWWFVSVLALYCAQCLAALWVIITGDREYTAASKTNQESVRAVTRSKMQQVKKNE